MDSLKRFVPPFLVLSALAGIVVGFRSFFMANIIEPISILCWAFWRIISSVNQNIYWMILIVICSFLMFRLVSPRKDNSSSLAYTYRYKSPNRVEYWQTLIEESILGKEEGERLRVNLENLFTSVTIKSGRTGPSDLDEIVPKGEMPLSLRATRFLLSSKGSDGALFPSYALDVISLIPKRLRRWAGKFSPQDTTAIAEILDYMENKMEISDDK